MQASARMKSEDEPEFPAVETIAGLLDAGALVVCDHASNALPPEYGDLGLPTGARERHIAYDIGAAEVTRRLAAKLRAPAVLSTFSRLLIDPNRGADDPTLVMRYSDGAVVPGNARVNAAEIARRLALYWKPYRDKVTQTTEAMIAAGQSPAFVSVHSFTPVWRGVARPWQVGVLWDVDSRLARPLLDALAAEPDLGPEAVGDNEPYDGALKGDTIDMTATARGLTNILIEIRQDLIADSSGAEAWADRLARLLRPILADPSVREPRRLGTRVQRGRGGRG
jgi:predicted N-formylglutamate amidohydrolase